jgi:hypothetical protein
MRLKGFYVEVLAESMENAREKFFSKFANTELPHPCGWDRVQTESTFVKTFYPNGLLKQLA